MRREARTDDANDKIESKSQRNKENTTSTSGLLYVIVFFSSSNSFGVWSLFREDHRRVVQI